MSLKFLKAFIEFEWIWTELMTQKIGFDLKWTTLLARVWKMMFSWEV